MLFTAEYLQYRQDPAISQSDIKLFQEDIVKYHRLKILGERRPEDDETSKPMELGDVTDLLLIEGEKRFKELYFVLTDWKATEKIKDIVDAMWREATTNFCNPESSRYIGISLEDFRLDLLMPQVSDYLVKMIIAMNWQPNWKLDTKINKIKEDGKEYLKQLKDANGRKMVMMDTYSQALGIIRMLKEDELLGHIARLISGEVKDPNIIVLKQTELFGEYKGLRIKGKQDFTFYYVDRNVLEPWDLKTSKNLAKFESNYFMSRYDIQGDMYPYLWKPHYPTSTILPFQFMVCPTESEQYPEIFKMSDKDSAVARSGGTNRFGQRVKGWTELLDEIKWHTDNNKWQHRKSYYEDKFNHMDSYAEANFMVVKEELTAEDLL